jgi:hypothetical protein
LALTSARRYEHAPLVGHAFKLLRASIPEGQTAPRDEILHCLRNEDFGGASQPADPCADQIFRPDPST